MATVDQTVYPPTIASFDWFGVLTRYGFATFIACALLAYLAFYIVEPMRHDQQLFIQSVIKTNEAHAEVAHKQTEIQAQQATALTNLGILLQQIRDDQRRGVWLEHKTNPVPREGDGCSVESSKRKSLASRTAGGCNANYAGNRRCLIGMVSTVCGVRPPCAAIATSAT